MEIRPVEFDAVLVITDVSKELAASIFIAVHSEPHTREKGLFIYLIFENIVRR
jgi:hypothetical protein